MSLENAECLLSEKDIKSESDVKDDVDVSHPKDKDLPFASDHTTKQGNNVVDTKQSQQEVHNSLCALPIKAKQENNLIEDMNCKDQSSLIAVKEESKTAVKEESQSAVKDESKIKDIEHDNQEHNQRHCTTVSNALHEGTVKVEIDTEASGSEEHDPYFYTKRRDFTSEIFKIEIRNLPHHLGFGQLRKFLNSQLRLETHKIKPIGSGAALQCVYVTFKNEEKREDALKLLDGFVWKGRKLVAKKASPMADPLVKKRSADDSRNSRAEKKMRRDESIPVIERLKNAVTPLWNMPYEEQLKIKESDMQQVLVKLGRDIEKNNKSLQTLIDENRKANSFQCCPMTPVKASPCTLGYRNKCEFTVGRHMDTNKKVVGFRLSSYKEGSMSVAEPDECPHISSTMLKAVKKFEEYIRASEKDVYNPETHEGYWRQFTVRTSRNGDVMIIVVIHPQNLSEPDLEKEKQELIKFFESGPGASCGVTSAFFQSFSRRQSQHEEDNLSHLFGKKFIEETLLGITFRISPNAFFQVNSGAAEVLYSTVAEVVGKNKSSMALDVCCGTGTITMCLSKQTSKVIGIEVIQQAVEDANLNAQINGITNVEFVHGKAEDVITDVMSKLGSSELTAVVDPPRAGLHPKVLKVIRACENVKKLVYVSCNVKAAMTNFVDLCRPTSNNFRGNPFYPVQAIPIDLFPHTAYCELVLVFERIDSSTLFK